MVNICTVLASIFAGRVQTQSEKIPNLIDAQNHTNCAQMTSTYLDGSYIYKCIYIYIEIASWAQWVCEGVGGELQTINSFRVAHLRMIIWKFIIDIRDRTLSGGVDWMCQRVVEFWRALSDADW